MKPKKQKRRLAKPVKAWAVMLPEGLRPYGNGEQFQLPVFHSRKEAIEWMRAATPEPERIARVQITEIPS